MISQTVQLCKDSYYKQCVTSPEGKREAPHKRSCGRGTVIVCYSFLKVINTICEAY